MLIRLWLYCLTFQQQFLSFVQELLGVFIKLGDMCRVVATPRRVEGVNRILVANVRNKVRII